MASDSFVNLREAECRIVRSGDARTTVDTIRSCAARVGGSFARFGCADGVVRTRLLRDSPHSDWERRIFSVLAREVAGLDLVTQDGAVDVLLNGAPSGTADHPDS